MFSHWIVMLLFSSKTELINLLLKFENKNIKQLYKKKKKTRKSKNKLLFIN